MYLRMVVLTDAVQAERYLQRLSQVPRYLAQAEQRLASRSRSRAHTGGAAGRHGRRSDRPLRRVVSRVARHHAAGRLGRGRRLASPPRVRAGTGRHTRVRGVPGRARRRRTSHGPPRRGGRARRTSPDGRARYRAARAGAHHDGPHARGPASDRPGGRRTHPRGVHRPGQRDLRAGRRPGDLRPPAVRSRPCAGARRRRSSRPARPPCVAPRPCRGRLVRTGARGGVQPRGDPRARGGLLRHGVLHAPVARRVPAGHLLHERQQADRAHVLRPRVGRLPRGRARASLPAVAGARAARPADVSDD